MVFFANNLSHALFRIFHPFVSSCFSLNFLLIYLPVTNSLFNFIYMLLNSSIDFLISVIAFSVLDFSFVSSLWFPVFCQNSQSYL